MTHHTPSTRILIHRGTWTDYLYPDTPNARGLIARVKPLPRALLTVPTAILLLSSFILLMVGVPGRIALGIPLATFILWTLALYVITRHQRRVLTSTDSPVVALTSRVTGGDKFGDLTRDLDFTMLGRDPREVIHAAGIAERQGHVGALDYAVFDFVSARQQAYEARVQRSIDRRNHQHQHHIESVLAGEND